MSDLNTNTISTTAELGKSISAGSGPRFGRRARLKLSNTAFRIACIASAVFVCLVLVGILALMLRTGILTFWYVSLKEFFFSTNWDPENNHFGALSFIFGTVALTALALIISIPFSIIIAVFLAEIRQYHDFFHP